MKKGLIATIIMLVVSIVICVFLGIESSQNYKKGYDDGAKDIATYEQIVDKQIEEITSFKSTISELQLSVDGYLEDIENLELNLNVANNDNDRLNNLVNDLREEAQSLNEQIELLNTTVASLESQIADLQAEIENKDSDNSNLKNTITLLENEIKSLNTTIKYYEDIINSYNFDTKSIVRFEVLGNYYDAVVVEKTLGFSKSIEDPSVLGYSFNGWSLDGVMPIELEGYFFTEDTTVTALMNEKEENYIVNSKVKVDHDFVDELGYSSTAFDFISNITINGNNIISLNVLDYYGRELLFFRGINLNLKDFSQIENNQIIINIPMSYIKTYYPEKVIENCDNYLTIIYEFKNEELLLKEFFVAYENLINVEITKTEEIFIAKTLNDKKYIVKWSENLPVGEEICFEGYLNIVNNEIYLLNKNNEVISLIEPNECGIYVAVGEDGGSISEAIDFCFMFYVSEDNTLILLNQRSNHWVGSLKFMEITENE